MDTTRIEQNRDPLTGQPPGSVIETKEFLRTSEFWITIATIVGLMLAGLSLNELDSSRVSTLIAVVATGYVVSRGVAKAGSAHPFWGREMPSRDRDRSNTATNSTNEDLASTLTRIEARLDRVEQTTGRVTL